MCSTIPEVNSRPMSIRVLELATLCPTCVAIDFQQMAQPVGDVNWNNGTVLPAYDTRLQIHQHSFAALLQSSEQCNLCALVLEAYVRNPLHKTHYPDASRAELEMRIHTSEKLEDDRYADPSHLVRDMQFASIETWRNRYADSWPVMWPQFTLDGLPPQIQTLLGTFVLQGRILTNRRRNLGLMGFRVGRIRYLRSHLQEDISDAWIILSSSSDVDYIAANPLTGHPDLDIAASWVSDCSINHPQCGAVSDHQLPTRVIDVGEEGIQQPRLVETWETRGRWAALSYCWGGAPPLTTRKTYRQNCTALPLVKLPRLFQDAIAIVRKSGLQYLWVDTLCIIQGDREDWERECSKMCTVYENSAFTLAASAATSPDGSLLHTRKSKPTCRFKFRDQSLSAGIGDIVPTFKLGMPKAISSPLAIRGWVLQERLLAPRVLYFGEQLMYMECRSCDYFEILREPIPLDAAVAEPLPKNLLFQKASGRDTQR